MLVGLAPDGGVYLSDDGARTGSAPKGLPEIRRRCPRAPGTSPPAKASSSRRTAAGPGNLGRVTPYDHHPLHSWSPTPTPTPRRSIGSALLDTGERGRHPSNRTTRPASLKSLNAVGLILSARPVLRGLGRYFRLVVPDNSGVGGSSRPTGWECTRSPTSDSRLRRGRGADTHWPFTSPKPGHDPTNLGRSEQSHARLPGDVLAGQHRFPRETARHGRLPAQRQGVAVSDLRGFGVLSAYFAIKESGNPSILCPDVGLPASNGARCTITRLIRIPRSRSRPVARRQP